MNNNLTGFTYFAVNYSVILKVQLRNLTTHVYSWHRSLYLEN
jgi:hypothetical protein